MGRNSTLQPIDRNAFGRLAVIRQLTRSETTTERQEMTTKEATCAERIASQLASEEENLRDIFAKIEGEEAEEGYEELYEYALGTMTHQKTIFTLSWGGPASYIEVIHNGAEIVSVVYRFSDWFDTATQELDEESPLYRYAQELINIQEGEC
jgi:hypothetical protein